MKLNPLAVALFACTVGSPLVGDTAHANPLPRPWIVWEKVSECAENRLDWLTVAQDDPTMYGLDHYQVAPGYQQTFDFSAAMAQMSTLRQGTKYSSMCCRTWSVWQQSGTGELGVMNAVYNTALGWQLEAGNMCCEEAFDRANIAGGCGTGLPLTRIQRNPAPAPTPAPTPTGGSNRICSQGGGPCFDLGGGTTTTAAAGPFHGNWQTDGVTISLTQSGNTASGTYNYDGGRISGTISGNTLTYRWSTASGHQGVGTATLSADGRAFSGPWQQVLPNGAQGVSGYWNGTKL